MLPSCTKKNQYYNYVDCKPSIDSMIISSSLRISTSFFSLSIAPSVAHEGSDVPVVMRGNDAYQMVKISRTGRDGVDMDQCPAYGVVGNR